MKTFSRNGWSPAHAIAAVVMVFLGIVATRGAWADIYHIASVDEEASHIFLVLPVAAWLIWVRRGRFRRCQPGPSFLGPIMVAAGWALSAWGFHNATQSLWHLGAVIVVVGCLLSVVGHDLFMRFLPAFVVLVFLVPIPGVVRESVSIPLMTTTAQVTQFVSEILGVPVDRSGNQLKINGKPLNVVEACNGLRLVFALVLVSYAFAFGEPLRNYVRFLILAACPLSAIVCNVIRLIPTVWLHGYWTEDMANRFHDIAGWVMLVVAFLLLMSIIRILRWALIPVTHYTLASE